AASASAAVSESAFLRGIFFLPCRGGPPTTDDRKEQKREVLFRPPSSVVRPPVRHSSFIHLIGSALECPGVPVGMERPFAAMVNLFAGTSASGARCAPRTMEACMKKLLLAGAAALLLTGATADPTFAAMRGGGGGHAGFSGGGGGGHANFSGGGGGF